MVAHAFLLTVGSNNIACIKSITLPMPFDYRLADNRNTIIPYVGKKAEQRAAEQIPFAIPRGWGSHSSFNHVCNALGTHCTNLRALNLVLPLWYHQTQVDRLNDLAMIQRLAKLQNHTKAQQEDLRVRFTARIVRIRKERPEVSIDLRVQQENKQLELIRDLEEPGWPVVSAVCDKYGGLLCRRQANEFSPSADNLPTFDLGHRSTSDETARESDIGVLFCKGSEPVELYLLETVEVIGGKLSGVLCGSCPDHDERV